MNDHVFALDIGTQSVTGIVLQKNKQSFTVSDYYTMQHKERAMLDGQIQDVVQVADVIVKVKEHLESKHGPLKNVCVAAAGRALKTIQTAITIPIQERPITTEEQIKHIELSAVQQAQFQLAEQKQGSFSDYHCVGYSVVHYKLDGEIIGSFIDQTGEEVSVEVIATFLPKVVVESLMAALERANLHMEALTLEPIAAIHVLVPESMRRLNVALIDIGAGTSDLAISNDGTIIAYGMVPVAGDEITEKVSDHFLLDFKLAEQLKRKVVDEEAATVQDILGFEVHVTIDELLTTIEESVDHLAKLLAAKITELNHGSPQAVMLIGGGSLTPMIDEKIATYLELPNNRVAVRGSGAIHFIDNKEAVPSGPDFVTPIGIAISATENPFQYMNVFVNGKNTFLFAMDELTIGNCFIQAGIDINDYYGKIGLAYFITINGEKMAIPGTYGTEPIITINDQVTTVENLVKENDRIHIVKGEDGQSPSVTIADIVGNINSINCYFNEKEYEIHPTYKANHTSVQADYIIQDNDHIIAKTPETIGEFFDSIHVDYTKAVPFTLYIDDYPIQFEQANSKLLLNGKDASLATPIVDGAKIELIPSEPMTIETILEKLDEKQYHQIHVTFNNEPVTLQQRIINVKRDGIILTDDDILTNNDRLEIEEVKKKDFIFQDIFRYVDFDVSTISGSYRVLCNEEDVSFQHVIQTGDNLSIQVE